MTLLLTLLGEQPIPNLLPLWQFPQFTQVQFAATERTAALAESLCRYIQADPALAHVTALPVLKIEAYDLAKGRAALAAAISQAQLASEPVTLNLTGGTKLMSLAALQAAFGSGIQLMYVSTEISQMIFLASDGAETRREPIRVQVGIDQYLQAHGLEVGTNLNFDPNYSPSPTEMSKQGDALEVQVYQQARDSGLFDNVRRGVFIRKQTARGVVVNELDIVAIYNGRLAVCSCKSGKSPAKESIYELASLSRREAFGIYCGKLLVSDRPNLDKTLRDRASSMDVRLVYGEKLNEVAQHIKAAIR